MPVQRVASRVGSLANYLLHRARCYRRGRVFVPARVESLRGFLTNYRAASVTLLRLQAQIPGSLGGVGDGSEPNTGAGAGVEEDLSLGLEQLQDQIA
eukprot:2222211-Pyramimonas_sp.AAC.1